MTLLNTIINIGHIFLGLNILVYLKIFFQKKKVFKIFTFYLLIITIIQITSQIYTNLNKNNLFLSHYYFIGQFLFLSIFYYQLIKQITLIKVLTTLTIVALTVQYSLYPEKYFIFNLFEIIICSIPLIIYSFLFFIQNIDGVNKDFIYINSGVFIYILSSTLIFSSGNLMPNLPKNINKIIWLVNAFLYVLYQILIFVEWYKNLRKTRTNT